MYGVRSLTGDPNCFFEYVHSVIDGLFGNSQWRANLDGGIAQTERREKQEATDKALVGDLSSHFAVWLGRFWFNDMHPGHQPFAMDSSNNIILRFELGQSGMQNPANGIGFF